MPHVRGILHLLSNRSSSIPGWSGTFAGCRPTAGSSPPDYFCCCAERHQFA